MGERTTMRRAPGTARKGARRKGAVGSVALVVGIAVVLAAIVITALTGGFATAPVADPEPERIVVGVEHGNDRFAVAVTDASIADENDASGHYPDEGERVLTVLVDVENVSDTAFSTTDGLRETILIPALGDDADVRISRVDDGTRSPWLQPGLPAALRVSWIVPADAVRDGDTIEVLVMDPHRYVLSTIATGTTWRETTPGALVSVVVRDEGAEAER